MMAWVWSRPTLAVKGYIDSTGIGSAYGGCGSGIEAFQLGHREVPRRNPRLIQDLDTWSIHSISAIWPFSPLSLTRDHTTIDIPRKLLGQILQHLQRSVRIRRVRLEQDGSNQTRVVLSILGAWSSVQVDENGKTTQLLSPVDGLDHIGVLWER